MEATRIIAYEQQESREKETCLVFQVLAALGQAQRRDDQDPLSEEQKLRRRGEEKKA